MGCTPRSPKGVRGPQPPARFRHFSAVKSAPPEAVPDCRRLSTCGKRNKPRPRRRGGYQPPASLCCQSAFFERTRLRRVRADEGIGPYAPTSLQLYRRGGLHGRPCRTPDSLQAPAERNPVGARIARPPACASRRARGNAPTHDSTVGADAHIGPPARASNAPAANVPQRRRRGRGNTNVLPQPPHAPQRPLRGSDAPCAPLRHADPSDTGGNRAPGQGRP